MKRRRNASKGEAVRILMVGYEFYHDMHRWKPGPFFCHIIKPWISRERSNIFCGGAGWE
jgi:hypothetical protein